MFARSMKKTKQTLYIDNCMHKVCIQWYTIEYLIAFIIKKVKSTLRQVLSPVDCLFQLNINL